MSLDRFTEAQEKVWPAPLEEIRRGRKDSHWMWFIFPQLEVLGRSATALYYGIVDQEEAEAYARKNGIAYRVEQPRSRRVPKIAYSDNFRYDRFMPWTH